MRKLASKISSYLLAPVILGASCLACLMQAAPAYAAPVSMERGMEQSQDCADYKKTTDSTLHQGMMAHANHSCASSAENAAFENKARQVVFNLDTHAVMAVLEFHGEIPGKNTDVGFFRSTPQKENFLTGCVIKRE